MPDQPMPGLARDPGAVLAVVTLRGNRPGHALPAVRSRTTARTVEKPRGVRAALRPVPAAYPATPVVSCCRNWGGVPGFLEAQIEYLGELIVPLVTTRAPGLSDLMLAVPPPWSCA
jgi:hypothetical protein